MKRLVKIHLAQGILPTIGMTKSLTTESNNLTEGRADDDADGQVHRVAL